MMVHHYCSGQRWASVQELKVVDIRGTIDKVPKMSEVVRTFVFEVIVANKRRLLGDDAK